MEKPIEKVIDGTIWRAKRRPSMFTSRNNANRKLEDVYIYKQEHDRSMGGTREIINGNPVWFRLAAIVACESNELIRDWHTIPDEFWPCIFAELIGYYCVSNELPFIPKGATIIRS